MVTYLVEFLKVYKKFKGIVSGLPSTIKLLELLPEVAKIFSLTF
jgi:hypothetical protein